ncbi:MAG: GNAT family N-acetyltransferase [Myxococcota bacterium]|nr:GNAT family N-acetyltransferase [Myxococcota bacterium]
MDPPRYELRAPLPEDAALLLTLYAHTREEELSAWGWPAPQRLAFVQMQHRVREASYRASRPHVEDRVVCVEGMAVGRLLIDRSGDALQLVDVALLPGHRGRGLGMQLIAGLCAEADREGRAITLEVLEHNPAARLYLRLGFQVRARQPPYLAMTRDPLPPGEV